jgi:hypothetical protein
MSYDGVEVVAADAVAALTAAVDRLLGLPVTSLPGLELLELARLVETQTRRLPALDHVLVAAVASSGVHADIGARNTATALVDVLRLSPGEAAGRVRAAKELGPRVDFTGGPMEPLYPAVAAAQADGDISVTHARVITATVHELPAAIRSHCGEHLERFLVSEAHTQPPDKVARTGKLALAYLDPDGTLASDEDHQRLRGLTIRPNPDGSSDIRGRLTPECTAAVHAVLDPLARPRPATTTPDGTTPDGAASDATAPDGTAPAGTAPAGTADPRTHAQRMHDALHDACQRLLRSATLPDSGGVPATVVVTMTLQQLEARLGLATTAHGGLVSIDAALKMAADAHIIPIVLGDGGGILNLGRTCRYATPAQRRALAARDGGCSFPGCDAPPAWCDAHHIIHWLHGGLTDLDNLTLLCGFHHRGHEKMGWECQITNGIPEWLPPWWIDAHRQPQRNKAHHLTDYFLPDAA